MISVAQEAQLGDIFWDLPTWAYYTEGYDLGCIIYVANPTDTVKEYALISHTYKNGALRGEGVLQVFGYTWFAVDPGDFIKLNGQLKLDESDVLLKVDLIEKETQAPADTVWVMLVTPTSAVMPPGWGVPGITSDWLPMMIMVMMMVMMMNVLNSATETEEEKKNRLEEKERKKALKSYGSYE